jgi:hypothetical protein
MRSIFLDYYIGSLLLWKGKRQNFQALSCEPVYGFKGGGDADYIVLDGQQRLTAVHYAFVAPDKPLPGRVNAAFYYIQVDKFMEEEYDNAFEYQWRGRYWTRVFETPSSQYELHIFPLRIVGSSGFELHKWVTEYEQYWRAKAAEAEAQGDTAAAAIAAEHARHAMPFGETINSIATQYQISYVELDQDLELDKV